MHGSMSMSILFAALLAGATACAPHAGSPAPARAPAESLTAGERVRVEYAPAGGELRTVAGRLLESDSAGLRIAADQLDTLSVARGELRGLWVSRGVRPRAAPVAAGALIGFVTGLLVAAAWDGDGGSPRDRDRVDASIIFGSATAGAILGSAVTGDDHWVRVPLR